MRKILALLTTLVLGFTCLPGQEITDPEELFSEGVAWAAAEEYEEALYYFRQLQEQFPDNANFNWKLGETYLNIPGQEHNAIPYLEKAITNLDIKYRDRDFDEDHAPHHAMFFLGNAYRIDNQVEKALEIYQRFVESEDYEGNYNESMVTEEVQKCERAYIIKDVPLEVNRTKLPPPVNNNSNNFNAIVSGDGNTLVFVTQMPFFDAIHLSKREEDGWSEPEVLNPQVQSDGLHYPTSINFDGTELYMVERQDNNNDLFVSYLEEPFWTKAEPLGKNINTRGHETHASISADGKKLYFTSDRRGGFGKLDVWLSEREEEGAEWGEPVNLGSQINTPQDEETPFISAEGSRLFFSSNGHFNMGGFDIFFSDLENGKWGDPVNLGYPVNTTSDDLFYFPIDNDNYGYYSVIEKDGPGTSDIYLVEILSRGAKQYETSEVLFDRDFIFYLINQDTFDTVLVRYQQDDHKFHLMQEGSKYKIMIGEDDPDKK